jgi:nitrogen fixation protein
MISRIAGTNIVSAYTPIAEMEERIIIILQADNGIACIAQSAQ